MMLIIALSTGASAQYFPSNARMYQNSAVQANRSSYGEPQAYRGQYGNSLPEPNPSSNQLQHAYQMQGAQIRPLPSANPQTPRNRLMPVPPNFQYEAPISAPRKGTISRFVSPFRPRVIRSQSKEQPPIRYANRPFVGNADTRWQEKQDQREPFSGIPVDQIPMPPETGPPESGPPETGQQGSSTENRSQSIPANPNQSGNSYLVPPGNATQKTQPALRENVGPPKGSQQGDFPSGRPTFEDLPVIDDQQVGNPNARRTNDSNGPPNIGINRPQTTNGLGNIRPLNADGLQAIPNQDSDNAPPFDPRDGQNGENRSVNPPVQPGNQNGRPQGVPGMGGPKYPQNETVSDLPRPEQHPQKFVDGEAVESNVNPDWGGLGTEITANGIRNPNVYENLPKRDAPTLWWDDQVVTPQSNSEQFWSVGVNDLLAYFLKNSPRIRAIRLLRDSSQSAVMESHAEFDPATYVESNMTRLNDPVGNELTTGGADRFKDDNWTSRAGLRQKLRQGGTWEAYQQLGTQTNNSDFFVPNEQGNAYLSLSFTQPLLNGRGKLYNESLIAIANLEIGLADGSAGEKIQGELLSITEKYWNLYTYRAIWFQRQENVRRAEKVYQELRRRSDIDVSKTQLFRAGAALATRKAALVEAYNNVRNVEVELAAILGIDSRNQNFEFVPCLKPELTFPEVDVRDAFVTALSNRPEIIQAGKKVQIAAEKANRSRHELKPVLDLLVSTYVSGLNDKFEFLNAFGRQFSDGAPGYSAGLNFEMPLHRRAAKARLERDELRWKAITSDLEDEILQVQSEVDIAVRYVDISYRKLLARETAMQSAIAELQAQQERMDLSLNEENLGLGLNLLLDSQDRLAEQENQLARAQADYMISWVSLKKAMGTLVTIE